MQPVTHRSGTIHSAPQRSWSLPSAMGRGAGRRAQFPSVVAAVLGFSLFAVLVFAHLDRTPRLWFDEGATVNVSKTLVQTGHYADRSSEGFRAFGATTSVGPTVMLPVAAVFHVFGIGLLQARLVIVVYLLVAITACLLLMHRLAGRQVAFVATALLLTAPGLDFIWMGRQVLGEVPAIAYLFVGFLVWFVRDETTGEMVLADRIGRGALAGLIFGLTIMTKSQLGIVLVPSFVVLAIIAWRWNRRIGVVRVLVPLGVMLIVFVVWEVALLTVVTGGSLQANLVLLRQASGGSLIVIAPQRMLAALRFLIGPDGYFALLAPALVYAVIRLLRRRVSVGELTLLIVSLVGLMWFMGASIAWQRYAFVPLALAALPVARFVTDSILALRQLGGIKRTLAPVGVVFVVGLMVVSTIGQVVSTLAPPDDAPQRMAAYLNQSVPTPEVIETWDPELGFLTDHNYHYPSPALLDRAVRHQWLGGPPLHDEVGGSNAPYLIVGPFARYTGIYGDAIATRYQPVMAIGDYVLYRLST